jgi:hydroxypyruvate isomerase
MPKFAANLTFLFKEFPFLERFQEAADAGFDAVEVLFPYDDSVSKVLLALQRSGLPLVLVNTPPPNWSGGGRGFAAIPGGEERFQHDFLRAVRYAERLKPRHIHIMAGNAKGPEARATLVRNLRWAAAQVPGQSLTIEPINSADMPGYFLNDFDLAADVLDEVNAKTLGLQFDVYQAHLITGDALSAWEKYKKLTRHIQVAGLPGRNEPGDGPIDFPTFFASLDKWGYVGYVGGEYNPAGRTKDGLAWLKHRNGQ